MRSLALATLLGACLVPACAPETEPEPTPVEASNPFLEDQSFAGKEDSAYLNPAGIEVEVDLEGDTTVTGTKQRVSPAYIGQFATTYLRQRGEFYLESLAEDATVASRIEWRVNGTWLSAAQAANAPASSLTHFRIRGVNSVLLHGAKTGVKVGTVFQAEVPLNPFTVLSQAAATCADPDDHMPLDAAVYWYLWNPDLPACKLATQQLSVTVSKMFPAAKTVYPEYDKLVADGKITSVILFGQIGDGAVAADDVGVVGMNQMAKWLKDASFAELVPAPVGRRFTKKVSGVDFEIDLYSPYDFSGLDDTAHFGNFQKAILEHEIVTYDGHSMLGASDFWATPTYPSFYQIFLYGGCLGYEYYVAPILEQKGGWASLDMLSSVVEVSAGANEFAGPVLAKVIWALQHGYGVSWKDILLAIRKRVGDSTFGVSGVRDNCFSPGGSLCVGAGEKGTHTYSNTTATAIPDNKPAGVTSTISVPDVLTAGSVKVDLRVTHTWVGDLRITLEHGGVTATLWDQAGGATQNISQSFALAPFAGTSAKGPWTLKLADLAADDTGTLDRWTLAIGP
ncbi:MAG: proprotein convertase P-domain-containing protein [Polyangiaceae bacterium]|nr:proprotein convertase P-domain-containing protein [Polyangiaceae bacterium]